MRKQQKKEAIKMKKEQKVDAATLAKELGSYKQLAFWNKFAKNLYYSCIIIDVLIAVMVIVLGGLAESAGTIIACSFFGIILFCVLWWFAYTGYMGVKLLLSYLYDIKQQRIAIERLTLLEYGEVCEKEEIKNYAGESMLKNMGVGNFSSKQ